MKQLGAALTAAYLTALAIVLASTVLVLAIKCLAWAVRLQF